MAFRADRLRECREALKAATDGRKGSQNWLADQVGAHVTSISDWERGRNEPSARYLTKLAAALGVSTDRLLDQEEAADTPLKRDEDTEILSALAVALEPFLPRNRSVAA